MGSALRVPVERRQRVIIINRAPRRWICPRCGDVHPYHDKYEMSNPHAVVCRCGTQVAFCLGVARVM